jgi:hypothetical protein
MRSTRLSLIALLSVSLAVGAQSFAHAQAVPSLISPSAVSAGLFLPSSSDAKNAGGSSELYLDAQYGLPVNIPFTPTRTVVSIEGEFGTHDGQHSNIIPLTVGEYFGGAGKSPFALHNFYGAVGAGFYLENIGSDSSSGAIGGYAAVGYNFALTFFVQAKYQIVRSANGPIVSVGTRF